MKTIIERFLIIVINAQRYKDKYKLVNQFEELVNKELQIKIRYIF